MTTQPTGNRVAIRPGIFSGDLNALESVKLQGTKCTGCGEVTLAVQEVCPNCGQDSVAPIPLSRDGTVWTYTVARNRPPGAYKGPEPFVPFGLGLVELAEGIRVYAPLEGAVDRLRVGAPVTFKARVTHTDDAGNEVVGFTFLQPA
jgi:uncharacterized protein